MTLLKQKFWFLFFVICLSVFNRAQAAALDLTSEQLQWINDISIAVDDVEKPEDILIGKTVRLYATVHNNSGKDIKGVVRFYNERLGRFIGTDQPFSAVAQGDDVVFIDVELPEFGENAIAIRAIPENSEGDNPSNNKITANLFADRDADLDSIGDRRDPDDDNDGTPDTADAFPLNAAESADTDHDGTGNNADPDDDNDDTPDTADAFPLDSKETSDRDGDGVGDNSDAFPNNPQESKDSDNDGVGDRADTNNANHGPVVVIGGSGFRNRTFEDPAPVQNSDTSFFVKDTPQGRVGEPMTFNASESYDPDGKVTTVTWDFGDGKIQSGVKVSHVFSQTGPHQVIVRLTDDRGESREVALPVTIKPAFSGWWKWGVPIFIMMGLVLARAFRRKKALFKKSK